MVHGIYIVDWDGDGRDEILTASFSGIHLYKFGAGGRWSRTEIAKGDPSPWPKSGSSDVAVGRIGQAALSWPRSSHGTGIRSPFIGSMRGQWQRRVIDDSLRDGHTILTADLNGDGSDEVIAGYRGKGVNVYLCAGSLRASAGPGRTRTTACPQRHARCGLNGDGRPDIACIGSATSNLKWYENLGPAGPK